MLLLLLLFRLGKGDKNAADQAAVDMMRKVLNDIPMVSGKSMCSCMGMN
jgi:fructose-1,6-bisphosphatase/sedoheptulose 1,7-bisphosphatase-like protein